MLPVESHLIPTPLVEQWGLDADQFNPDCLVACIIMGLERRGKRHGLTVNQAARETALLYGSNGLGPEQGVTLGMKHGLYLYIQRNVTLDMIRAEVAADRLVYCLGSYRFLPQPVDHDNTPFKDGHWLICQGFDPTHMVCNDPDVWFPYVERGHNILYYDANFDRFLAGTGNVCLFEKETQPVTPNEELDAILVQIQQLSGQARTKLAAIPTPPIIVVPPPAGSRSATVRDDGTNVRTTAAILTGNIFDTLSAGTKLNVSVAGIRVGAQNWLTIADGPDAGKFIAESTLSF